MNLKYRKELSSFDLLMLKNEFNLLSGGRIQKIFQKGKQLRFEIFVSGKGMIELLFEPGKVLTTRYKREASNERFSQYMRKHFSGQRIISVRQVGFERILEAETEKNILVLELFSKGNAIFCDKSRMILMPLEMQEWKHRKIAPKLPYIYPPTVRNPFAIGFAEFQDKLSKNEKGIAAFLASEMSLSGKYAEEVCTRANVKKDKKCKDIDSSEAKKLFDAIQSLPKESKPNLVLENGEIIDFAPIEMRIYGNKEKKYFPTFMQALDEFFSEMEKKERDFDISQIKNEYKRIIETQKSALEKWSEREEDCRKKGETIQNNIEQFQKIIDLIKELRNQKKGWKDVKLVLSEKTFDGVRVKEIKEKEGIAVAERIEIDFRKNARENVNEYFERAKIAKRKKESVRKALEKTENKMKEVVKKEQESRKRKEVTVRGKPRFSPRWFEKFRWFFTKDNFLVIGGRDASQNEIIFKRHMEKNDIVLHAEIHGAPLIVVKNEGKEITQNAIIEAAEFAAAYSSAWKRRLGGIDVYWIKPEQVSKKPPAGTYLAKGAFMIYGQKNYIRNISLKIAIGVKFEQDKEGNRVALPICGTLQSMSVHAKYFVVLVPGAMPHGELTKEIKKRFLANAFPEDKPLMETISLDDFERLIPAGNSDM